MTPDNAWIYAVLPFVTMAALTFGLVVVFRQRAAARRAADTASPEFPSRGIATTSAKRPWWGNPWLWLAVCTVFVLLGVFVWPWLFSGVIVVLPFVWIRRPHREPTVDPRTNGHSHRDAGMFRPE
jgi:hypothetical protein